MAYVGDSVPTNNKERAALKAEEIADAEILALAEEDVRESGTRHYDWSLYVAIDSYESEYWDEIYKEAYDKTLAELNTPKFNNRAHKFFEMA